MDFDNPPDSVIRAILSRPTTVAVVGCSQDPGRDSLHIATLLKRKGFRVIPVNPMLRADALIKILGERCYPDLASIPDPVEIVDVFRQPAHLPAIVEDAIAKGARVLWCQTRRGECRRGAPRAECRADSRDGPLPRDRVPAPVLMRCNCRSSLPRLRPAPLDYSQAQSGREPALSEAEGSRVTCLGKSLAGEGAE